MMQDKINSTIIFDKNFAEPAERCNKDYLQKNIDYIRQLENKKRFEREVAQNENLKKWSFRGNKASALNLNHGDKGKTKNLNDSKANTKYEKNQTRSKVHVVAVDEKTGTVLKNAGLKKRKPLSLSPISSSLPLAPPQLPTYPYAARALDQEHDKTEFSDQQNDNQNTLILPTEAKSPNGSVLGNQDFAEWSTQHNDQENLDQRSDDEITVIMAMEAKSPYGSILRSESFEEWPTQCNDANTFECLNQKIISKNEPVAKTVEQPTMEEVLKAYRDRQPQRHNFGLAQTLKHELYDTSNIPLTNDEPSMADILQMSKSRTQVTQHNTTNKTNQSEEVEMSLEELITNARRPPPPTRRSQHLVCKPRDPSPENPMAAKATSEHNFQVAEKFEETPNEEDEEDDEEESEDESERDYEEDGEDGDEEEEEEEDEDDALLTARRSAKRSSSESSLSINSYTYFYKKQFESTASNGRPGY